MVINKDTAINMGLVISLVGFSFWFGKNLTEIEVIQSLHADKIEEIDTTVRQTAKEISIDLKGIRVEIHNVSNKIDVLKEKVRGLKNEQTN